MVMGFGSARGGGERPAWDGRDDAQTCWWPLRPAPEARGHSPRARAGAQRWVALASAFGALGLLLGCKTGPAENAKSPTGEVRDTTIVHEPCDVDGDDVVAEDVNGDKRADLMVVGSGDREVCRAVDLNFDGKVDVWSYREPSGAVRRRESDFDRDGRIDEIALYRGGELYERHRATSLRGRLDTWQYYEKGRLVRAVRDSDGDSMIDEWWEYPSKGSRDCPLVHSDADHDGRPDPGSTVNLCSEELQANKEQDEPDDARLKPREAMPVELTRAAETQGATSGDGKSPTQSPAPAAAAGDAAAPPVVPTPNPKIKGNAPGSAGGQQ